MKKFFLLLLIVPFLWAGSCSSNDNSPEGIKVTLNKTSVTLITGKTVKLTAVVTPANTPNKAVTWSTSNSSVVTVSAGTVTAVAEGSATITVTTKDGGKTADCIVTVTQRPVTDIGAKDGLSNKTAAEYFEEKNIFIGWNLGNGFDAGAGYGSWTRKIDENFLPKIKEEGFSMVRIPVTWNVSINRILTSTGSGAATVWDYSSFNETNFRTTLTEVKQVVDWAYDAGLVTIVNIHHDGSGTNGWLSITRAATNTGIYDGMTSVFTKIWELIAEEFKDYGDWLIFEPFNELHNGGWGWGTINPDEFDVINDLNQIFTDTVRAAGGKNTERFLVIQPYCAKPHQSLEDTFVLPTDTTANKQIVSIHYYDPEPFALRGTDTNWGSAADYLRITNDFERYASKFTENNIPVIMGESGATYQNRTDTAQLATAQANRLLYMDWMGSEARRNKIVPVYWDNGTTSASSIGENFGLWDRRPNGDLNVIPGMQEVIDAMINAVQ
ncbi:MAG: cellulase family glycosylhydrolase [Treponema sp.]|jgi:endoglucanase|nr:cellulase family glycosylhydrolase [Treponema sp.]